jgi:hypothetical protein
MGDASATLQLKIPNKLVLITQSNQERSNVILIIMNLEVKNEN